MQIWVGLTNKELTSLTHKSVRLQSSASILVHDQHGNNIACSQAQLHSLTVTTSGSRLKLSFAGGSKSHSGSIFVSSSAPIQVDFSRNGKPARYQGELRLSLLDGGLRLSLKLSLDQYLSGVLSSEMPASYEVEALKGQALCARTYALHPRISHEKDAVNVCDSFLCCQYYAGLIALDRRIAHAIESTASEVLTCEDKPILALFSSNAGGHTENYENCFSDPLTNAFPPAPIPYLRGVPEADFKVKPYGTEAFLRYLYSHAQEGALLCADAWTPKFKFRHSFSHDSLEAHLHHVVMRLSRDLEAAPFVIPPRGGGFGRVRELIVKRRGVSGVAIELEIVTTAGSWTVKKELLIRRCFENPDYGLKRLNSARIFFDHQRKYGELSEIVVSGLGFGHGVGFQQTGAQGFAKTGMKYGRILAHYFPGASISKL